jgi:hypothetical protein
LYHTQRFAIKGTHALYYRSSLATLFSGDTLCMSRSLQEETYNKIGFVFIIPPPRRGG